MKREGEQGLGKYVLRARKRSSLSMATALIKRIETTRMTRSVEVLRRVVVSSSRLRAEMLVFIHRAGVRNRNDSRGHTIE